MKLESLTTSLRSVARELRRGLKEREEEAAIVVEEAKARVLLRAVLLVRGARVGGTVNSFRHCQLQLSIYIYKCSDYYADSICNALLFFLFQ